MSRELEQAREQFAAGRDKKALAHLWRVEAAARSDPNEAEALLELASAIHARSGGRVQAGADLLVGYARSYLKRFDARSRSTIADLRRCQVVASHGFGPKVDEFWALGFAEEAVFLHHVETSPERLIRLEYSELTDIEVGDPAPYESVGVVNRLRGGVDGIAVTLRTPDAELVLWHRDGTPEVWRADLAPALAKLGPRGDAVIIMPRCRVQISEGGEFPADGLLDLLFTEQAVLLRGAQVVSVAYADFTAIEVSAFQPTASIGRKVARGTARQALAWGSAILLSALAGEGGDGAGTSAWSKEVFERFPQTRIGFRTSHGELVVVHQSRVEPDEWRRRLAPALARLERSV